MSPDELDDVGESLLEREERGGITDAEGHLQLWNVDSRDEGDRQGKNIGDDLVRLAAAFNARAVERSEEREVLHSFICLGECLETPGLDANERFLTTLDLECEPTTGSEELCNGAEGRQCTRPVGVGPLNCQRHIVIV